MLLKKEFNTVRDKQTDDMGKVRAQVSSIQIEHASEMTKFNGLCADYQQRFLASDARFQAL